MPGSLKGFKIPDMVIDSKIVNYKLDRLRMLKSEKLQPIEFKLREYTNNASIYTSSRPKN